MREGEVVRPSSGETVTCVRSGQSGGPFVFDLDLAPGSGRPPTHTHDEGDELVEVVEGELTFVVNGRKTVLHAGDTLLLTPKDAHTFWNASKATHVRARVTHGARFERFIVQPGVTALMMYLTYVDPGASRATNPLFRGLGRAVAWVGRMRGVAMVNAATPAESGS
jgi:mannose-6-phosphate isomerase-like protein (cupin superfamily)